MIYLERDFFFLKILRDENPELDTFINK